VPFEWSVSALFCTRIKGSSQWKEVTASTKSKFFLGVVTANFRMKYLGWRRLGKGRGFV
jgi:hypothetical protein